MNDHSSSCLFHKALALNGEVLCNQELRQGNTGRPLRESLLALILSGH